MTITPSSGYGTAKFIVSTTAGQGNYTTLASAMAAASSGDTIFMRSSVTENVTITPGVNITGWSGVGDSASVSITGKLTMTGAGTSTISNIRLTTNSDNCIAVTGSAASILNVENCYINASNNTAITYSSSSGSSIVTLKNCQGNLGTTGIAYFASSGAGQFLITRSVLSNSGGSSTANTVSAGQCVITWSSIFNPITSSGSSALLNGFMSIFDCSSTNSTCITHGSTAASQPGYRTCEFYSGTASAISISASCSLPVLSAVVNSSNTNAITGSGTLSRGDINFTGTSSTINTTTVTQLKFLPKVAPTVQVLTSGTAATYTTPANCQWIRIRMVGGGGGGEGSGASAGTGGAGTASTFSGGTLSAGGGSGGAYNAKGGTSSGGNIANLAGNPGQPRPNNSSGQFGGNGGSSMFGGAGQGGDNGGHVGYDATANSGSGGGGAGGGGGGTPFAGSGGGAGGYVEHIINGPAASYTYTVGSGGSAGTAGTGGAAGGTGAAGLIIVEEYYL